MRQKLLQATELPPGSTMLPRMGKALTGQEIMEAVVGCAVEMLMEEGVSEVKAEEIGQRAREVMAAGDWAKGHLTYPKAEVEVEVREKDGKWGILGLMLLAQGMNYGVEVPELLDGWRKVAMRRAGPTQVPDDMREALGLPLTAQFRLPTGERVMAQLPTAGEPAKLPPRVQQLVDLPTGRSLAEQLFPSEEVPPNPLTSPPPQVAAALVGEPPALKLEPRAPQVVTQPAKGKGGRK